MADIRLAERAATGSQPYDLLECPLHVLGPGVRLVAAVLGQESLGLYVATRRKEEGGIVFA